jgi:hypothetical protein
MPFRNYPLASVSPIRLTQCANQNSWQTTRLQAGQQPRQVPVAAAGKVQPLGDVLQAASQCLQETTK